MEGVGGLVQEVTPEKVSLPERASRQEAETGPETETKKRRTTVGGDHKIKMINYVR